jgi:hypothetical protein
MTINYNENRKDIQIDKLHEDLVAELEAEASKYEVTCDYYIAEFTNLSIKR